MSGQSMSLAVLWSLVEPRPKTIPVVASFLFFAAGMAFVVGVSLLFPNPLLDGLWELNKPAASTFRPIGRILGIPLFLLGIGTFVAAMGLLRCRVWAWWFAVVLFTVDGIGDIVSFIVTGDWVKSVSGVVISSAFLWSLTRTHVRHYLKDGPPPPNGSLPSSS